MGLSLLLKLDLSLFVCLFVCPVCIKVIGNRKLLKMLYISLSAVFSKKVNNFNKT